MTKTIFKTIFCIAFASSFAHAVPKKTVIEKSEKTERSVKKETVANNWGFTPVRDLSEENAHAKKIAKAEVPVAARKPVKALSSGFKGFTPVRDDLAHDQAADAKKPAKTEVRVRRK